MKTVMILLALLCAGCARQAESTSKAGVDFEVETLFTKDGCTVYRFWDAGHRRYFTNCAGTTSYSTQSGKTSYPDGVEGGAK